MILTFMLSYAPRFGLGARGELLSCCGCSTPGPLGPPPFLFFSFLSLVCRNQVLRDSAGRPGGRGGGGSYLSPKMGISRFFHNNENDFQRSKINTLWTTSLAAGRSSGLSDSISMTRPAS